MPFRLLLATALALLAANQVLAQRSPVGLYRAQAGPDTASVLELTSDGRFRYELSEGALDESASGRWTATPDGFELDTLPHPRAPEWTLAEIGEARGTPFSVLVKVPGSGGIAGIDLRIGFTNGDSEAAYTQTDGWSMPPEDMRQPAWLELSEPIHGASSPRFLLPARRNMAVTVMLVPNDIGVAKFERTPVSFSSDGIVVHWRGRDIPYARVGRTRRAP